jgi:hypothetical protein
MHKQAFLARYYLEKFILEVAIATLERGGVTSNLHTYEFLSPIDAWGVPRDPEKTQIVAPDADILQSLRQFIHANTDALRAPGCWLGTWINPATHCCYLDITEILPTLAEARDLAIQRSSRCSRDIEAIYNFKRQETVYLQEEKNYAYD